MFFETRLDLLTNSSGIILQARKAQIRKIC